MKSRPRKCKHCKSVFSPSIQGQVACGVPCALELGKKAAAREAASAGAAVRRKATAARVQRKADLERFLTIRDYTKRAQAAFNRFICLRDEGQPCICCGRTTKEDDLIRGNRWAAGHYRSTGTAPHLRFDERNVHLQLVMCNRHRGGAAVDYRIRLIQKIGLAEVEALEADNAPRIWTREELISLAEKYKAKARAIEKARQQPIKPELQHDQQDQQQEGHPEEAAAAAAPQGSAEGRHPH